MAITLPRSHALGQLVVFSIQGGQVVVQCQSSPWDQDGEAGNRYIYIYSVRTKSVETSWWETGSRNSMLCCHVNPCQQNHFWNPYKCSENLLNHLDPYHFAKRLLCSGVIRIDTLQLTHQGSDLRWLLKNWINKLLEHILRPVGLAQCGKNRFLHCICKNINETLLYSCSA